MDKSEKPYEIMNPIICLVKNTLGPEIWKKLHNLKRLFRACLKQDLNLKETIRFNKHFFKKLSLYEYPILLFGDVKWLGGPKGQISFWAEECPPFGSWEIGKSCFFQEGYAPENTMLVIHGHLILGNTGHIGNATQIVVWNNAELCLGNSIDCGNHTKIVSLRKIVIGEWVRISWETQIMDTNFHYMVSPNNTITNNASPIYIGSYVWIGNRVTIGKGSKLSDGSIVACNSLVNKDFSMIQNGTFGGIPAKLITSGYRRIFNKETEEYLYNWFWNNAPSNIYNSPNNIVIV